jgi:polo-like kinase 1
MKTDCWSFGCILYALVTGKPPFEKESIQETLKNVKKKIDLKLPGYLSKNLVDLLEHIIVWDAEERFNV